jgi:putative nucleotidyltransferase with HDIG domain
MLRKIPVQQLRIGMFVHEVCGSWMDHPFWRSSFMLETDQQLAQLAKVSEVIIDTSKGLDVEATATGGVALLDDIEVEAAPGQAGAPAEGLPVPPLPLGEPGQRAATMSFEQELARASRIVAQARGAMQSMFRDARLGKAMDAVHCLPLVDEITQSVSRNPSALVSLARLKTSDDYTYMHSVAVCALMVALAHELGLDEADTREAGLGGLVHDIGKALMPLDVLNKPGALTHAEFAIMKGHPEAGHRLLLEGQGVGPGPLDICLHHHEKVNGRGYPHGLKGDDISLFARMGAVCDVYDAITSNRAYKAGWDPAESIQKMAQWTKDGHFDEAIFQAFVKSIGIYPTGSLVKLRSGKLGVVVEQGERSLLQPKVRVFFSTKSNEPITPVLLDLSKPHGADQIVSRESPADWGFANTDQFWLTL